MVGHRTLSKRALRIHRVGAKDQRHAAARVSIRESYVRSETVQRRRRQSILKNTILVEGD